MRFQISQREFERFTMARLSGRNTKLKRSDMVKRNELNLNELIFMLVKELNLSAEYIERLWIERFLDYIVMARHYAKLRSKS